MVSKRLTIVSTSVVVVKAALVRVVLTVEAMEVVSAGRCVTMPELGFCKVGKFAGVASKNIGLVRLHALLLVRVLVDLVVETYRSFLAIILW